MFYVLKFFKVKYDTSSINYFHNIIMGLVQFFEGPLGPPVEPKTHL